MIKFKTINGTLCRMVEPTPLTPESQFPCVVRLIQDDSPMGRYNQSYSEYRYGVRLGCCMLPIIATHIAKNGIVNDIEWDVNRYEVIGYPVEYGSHYWALWWMEQGDKVCLPHVDNSYYEIEGNYIYRRFAHHSHAYTSGQFLADNTSGWRIYEPQPEPKPKPLLAYAQVGDLCKRRDGKWVQVDSYSTDRPCPVMCKSDIGGQDCFTLDGRNHNAINDSKDIIHTEPLAPKGTAEWAWQMMLLGKMVSNIKHPDDAMFIEKDIAKYINSNNIMTHERRFFCATPTDGWQLYEKPKPSFKVGDCVELIDGTQCCIEVVGRDLGKGHYYYFHGHTGAYEDKITRKLDPSEVKVKVMLEGTVERAGDDRMFLVHRDGHTNACIMLAMLDAPTRELVDSLMKAQEEE